ncbi:MAG TPA: UDP-N-acetylmuramoyl-L-alanyl-D-glutamate--2,6-diaminopimelate ligase [Firmicutes bacterium]|nr:UDP-N-acetylmuramoyl-L-alanyl-D-glutamate--2,6-diaminopimelate ligase [Bacillota bacterium]
MINIKTNSRKVKPGDTFVAIKGFTVDGHDYIEDAIKAGATKIVCEHGSYSVETLVVPSTKEWVQKYIVDNYKDEVNKLRIIGVTGTNGKTTTCFLTYQALKKLGVNAAYMGTIGFYYGDTKYELNNTTPEILDLYSYFIEALEHGVTDVVMEVSSHSLCEKRVEGLEFSEVAFTNLTEDHLDYHKTMENYLNAKLLILKQIKKDGVVIVNNDDDYGKYFEVGNYKTLGYSGDNYKILDYSQTDKGTLISFMVDGKKYEIETNLRSKFNVYNYLTCLALLNNLGFSIEEIAEVTKSIYPPKGRCEQISVNGGEAVIDYAHTPDAVDKIISAFLENKKGKVITIVGCGGDRDPLKRPIMGNIASEKSDYVIFTSDNPRTEDPKAILEDIIKGVRKDNYEVEIDRPTAIRKGLDMIGKNDVLLILGKGHEDYQIIGHTKHHLDDAEEVRKYLEAHKN